MATTTNANSAPTTNSISNNKVELGLLEEDDEFEEFETENWNENDSKEVGGVSSDANLWEDNWDDDNVEDDFTVQLR